MTLLRGILLSILLLAAACDGSDPVSRGNGPPPVSALWQAGPIIGGKNYSLGVAIEQSSGLPAFDIPLKPLSVHYVTQPAGLARAASIYLRYRVDGGPVTGANCPLEVPSAVTLYFQRSGDDWSGAGKYETYRWWATSATGSLTPGEHEIDVPLNARWTAVETSNSVDQAQAFHAALANTARVGFTFSNCMGYGHGAWVTAVPARFTVLDFKIVLP